MSDQNDQDAAKSKLSLRPSGGRLELNKTVDAGTVRQSFSHGRSKAVQVEVKKTRVVATPSRPGGPQVMVPAALANRPTGSGPAVTAKPSGPAPAARAAGPGGRPLTAAELATRQRVLEEQRRAQAQRERELREQQALMVRSAAEEAARKAEEDRRQAEEDARAAEEQRRADAEAAKRANIEAAVARVTGTSTPVMATPVAAAPAPAAAPGIARPPGPRPIAANAVGQAPVRRPGGPAATTAAPGAPKLTLKARPAEEDEERRGPPRRAGGPPVGPGARRMPPVPVRKTTPASAGRRDSGRVDVTAAIEGEDERSRTISSIRRARERERRQAELARLRSDQVRVVRDVIVPEVITVQELANRMAARGGEVVKALFRMGVMATLTQSIDADTAELVVQEFGHRARRVADNDVELGLVGPADADDTMTPRPPVVTIMGHVDHGKTSLLDALRKTDVAAREAGGITQHIGAYQVNLPDGERVTFIDTPGHEAFTAMRARGASVTDMVVLVVAADDGVMPQTIEAIRHAKAANVPLIVAVNKIDKPGVNPARVQQELLSHDVVVEDLGGDTQVVLVSAKEGTNLDKLLEAIILQAEVLDLRAAVDRPAEGTVIESRLDKGRGPVATVLVQRGTLRQGDIVVAGAEWGRLRAIVDDKAKTVKEVGPSAPVEILGLSGVPGAGDVFTVVENEARAREISEFRTAKLREKAVAALGAGRGTLAEMLARIQTGVQKEVAVVVKADVQGSAEAIGVTLGKQGNDEVKVRVLHSGVGQITESDIQLAKASDAVVIAFNVRATSQAREMATRDGIEIRYYSIIYEVADDIEKLVRGKLSPVQREKFLGYAQILQVFEVKRLGNVAGCRVTEGVVRRGAGVRLLRDGVVIHQGELSTLRRFKDDVKEVANGYECGMSFARYDDIRVDDQIECYETETVAGTL
ncbi:translation initiation factor 2 (bIF-2) [Humitalea rosea]|uniref:Translation initiation factor IF-2 n=1 Tax=Humitalea rosea TaxID=990373 RepID=A0A2W7INM8_9PROT|nr:translation initiation factor IF-2 [Humitalea rosea]PZW46968.1 translation initiation factor 2 (bIF-2) [Humitalea rosea]